MLTPKEQSDIVVQKTDFDSHIYQIVYERIPSEKRYVSSSEVAHLLNEKKVIVLDKKRKALHRNFYMVNEVI